MWGAVYSNTYDGVTWHSFSSPINAISYLDETVNPNTVYGYKIRSFMGNVNSDSTYNSGVLTAICAPLFIITPVFSMTAPSNVTITKGEKIGFVARYDADGSSGASSGLNVLPIALVNWSSFNVSIATAVSSSVNPEVVDILGIAEGATRIQGVYQGLTANANITVQNSTSTFSTPQCSDGIDNDNDGKIDRNDPACHTDGNVLNNASYNQNLNDENSRPVITLLGNATATTTEGDMYTDAGATAVDEEDGNITSRIVVGGNIISTSTSPGTYLITFNVTDLKGAKAATTTRTVIVNQKQNNGGGGGGGGNGGGGGGSSGGGGNNGGGGGTSVTTSANGPIGFSGFAPVIPAANFNTVVPRVLGAKIKKEKNKAPYECNYLLKYLKFGRDNDQMEVMKLQLFLKDLQGFKEVVATGMFDRKTFEAVHKFQKKFKEDILEPWALPSSTGYVYITTRKKINEIYCEKEFALTAGQQREIAEFNVFMKELLALRRQGNSVEIEKEIENLSEEVGKATENKTDIEVSARESESSSINYSTSTLATLTGFIDINRLFSKAKDNQNKEKIFTKITFYLSRHILFAISVIFLIIFTSLAYLTLKNRKKDNQL